MGAVGLLPMAGIDACALLLLLLIVAGMVQVISTPESDEDEHIDDDELTDEQDDDETLGDAVGDGGSREELRSAFFTLSAAAGSPYPCFSSCSSAPSCGAGWVILDFLDGVLLLCSGCAPAAELLTWPLLISGMWPAVFCCSSC